MSKKKKQKPLIKKNTSERVKILDTLFDEEFVYWHVELLNSKKKATLQWKRKEFGQYFGINKEIPLPLLKEFCDKMVGQERNLLIES